MPFTLTPELGALVLNAAGLIWGASRMHSAIQSLSATTTKLDTMVTSVALELSDHRTRIVVLEDFRGRTEVIPIPSRRLPHPGQGTHDA